MIQNIDIGKSSAVEQLSSRILKDSFEILTLELTQLYNKCLVQGYFPKDWTAFLRFNYPAKLQVRLICPYSTSRIFI